MPDVTQGSARFCPDPEVCAHERNGPARNGRHGTGNDAQLASRNEPQDQSAAAHCASWRSLRRGSSSMGPRKNRCRRARSSPKRSGSRAHRPRPTASLPSRGRRAPRRRAADAFTALFRRSRPRARRPSRDRSDRPERRAPALSVTASSGNGDRPTPRTIRAPRRRRHPRRRPSRAPPCGPARGAA
jgi:hypothetical protein